MKKTILALLVLSTVPVLGHAKTYKEMFGHDPHVDPKYAAVLNSMDFKQGMFQLSGANAALNVTTSYYYLNPSDTRKVLVDLWGNPPYPTEETLGMIFPVKYTPDDQGNWGAILSYKPDGYVSDDDAASTDFNGVLADLQNQTAEGNAQRVKVGYEPIQLVGWASPPFYDKSNHALHWARDLLFGTDTSASHTLNYQLRKLGREGILEVNFVAGMPSLTEIKTSIPEITSLAEFANGKKYSDYTDGDTIAAYGLGGLIAAGAGAKIAAKIGFLAIALAFLKKGFFVVLIAAGAVFKPILSFFRKKPDNSA